MSYLIQLGFPFRTGCLLAQIIVKILTICPFQYLRELARDAIRVVVDVMREELVGGSHQRGARAVFLARSTYLLISDGH
jgi:hypothetical protein